MIRCGVTALSWLLAVSQAVAATSRPAATKDPIAGRDGTSRAIDFALEIKPLFARYCYDCHGEKKKGGLDLRVYTSEQTAAKDRAVFEKVLNNLQAHEMPPENKPQPAPPERELITRWVTEFFFPCDCQHPDPGRVTIRRLNRVEYNNTIRDLVGVDFQPAKDFPADDTGYGFDNIGDVLSLSPLLLEKYLAAAEKILDAAIVTEAPTDASVSPLPETHRRIFIRQPTPQSREACAREIIGNFARRAFRRPVRSEELDRLVALFKTNDGEGGSFERSIRNTLQAVLVSPHFLFRGEWPDAPGGSSVVRGAYPIDDFALASRLSYFLWSSMPDEELFRLAERGRLRRNLAAHVRRMVRDPKSAALVENFAGQWLQLRNLDLAAPDAKLFPEFNEDLREAMRSETEMFFDFVLRNDRSLLELLDAKYSFLDARLAKLYGIEGVQGDGFRRVSFKGAQRGGLLTQASVLTITSNPTRTSPVKRGKWVLENILGTPPPPPPPNVPELKEGKDAVLQGTLRQRMEQHRKDPNCSSCHERMDPIGFGFENYDAIGTWREQDGGAAVDPSGKLVSGEAFNGPAELKQILLRQRRAEFVRTLTAKLLTYALGRGLEYYDKCALDEITSRVTRDGFKLSTLVLEIARSTPFQMSRGEPAAVAELAR